MSHDLPPGVTRDPDTGEFRSHDGDQMTWTDTRHFATAWSYLIPAADLSGDTEASLTGGATERLNFSELLGVDELFVADVMYVSAYLAAPTTATAEGAVTASWYVGRFSASPLGDAAVGAGPWGNSPGEKSGIVDINASSNEVSEILREYRMYAENSAIDTGTSVGAGGSPSHIEEVIPFSALHGTGPWFDQDDELYVPATITADNVDDHAVQLAGNIGLRGRLFER